MDLETMIGMPKPKVQDAEFCNPLERLCTGPHTVGEMIRDLCLHPPNLPLFFYAKGVVSTLHCAIAASSVCDPDDQFRLKPCVAIVMSPLEKPLRPSIRALSERRDREHRAMENL